jgi:hypothetical protein
MTEKMLLSRCSSLHAPREKKRGGEGGALPVPLRAAIIHQLRKPIILSGHSSGATNARRTNSFWGCSASGVGGAQLRRKRKANKTPNSHVIPMQSLDSKGNVLSVKAI